MEIKVLNKEEIQSSFTMLDAIQADKDALAIYSRKGANIPLRVNLDIKKHEGQSLYMPGYAEDANALGIKIVSVYPNNINKGIPSVPATMVLLNEETGEVCALLDGTYLTQLRTGAVAGAATDVLARKDARVFAIFGTGGQAETQVAAVLAIRDIELVKVYDLDRERAQAFADKMHAQFNIEFMVADSSEEAIKDADIITCVTTSKKPLFDGTLVKKGAHINGVGSYTPEMQEINEYTLTHAGAVYVDTRDGVLSEAGDVIIPINKGIFKAEDIKGELGEVINGDVDGRTSDDQITVFKTTGTAVLDVVSAKRIYEKALEKGKGSSITL